MNNHFKPTLFHCSIILLIFLSLVPAIAGALTVSGHIYDSNHNSVCGSAVSITDNTGLSIIAITDVDGGYSITVPVPGTYNAQLSYLPAGPGLSPCGETLQYPPYTTIPTPLDINTDTVRDFTLPPVYRVTGQVKDLNGVNIGNVRITFSTPLYPSVDTFTDGSGNYSAAVYQGNYTVTLTGQGFNLEVASNLPVDKNMTQDFIVPAMPVLSGHVYDSNHNSVCGATLALNSSNGYVGNSTTLEDGSYRILVPTPGTYTVSFFYLPGSPLCTGKPTYPSYSSNAAITLDITEDTVRDFTLPPVYNVTGQVKDSNGVGLGGGVNVVFSVPPQYPPLPSTDASDYTDDNSNYQVAIYAGIYNVTLQIQGNRFSVASNLAVNADMTQDFIIAAMPVLSGTVYDSDHNGVCGATLTLYGHDNPYTAGGTTNADGRYSISIPTAGTYYISLVYYPSTPPWPGSPCEGKRQYPSYSLPWAILTIDQSTIQNFTLPPVYTVTGHIKNANGTGAGNVSVYFYSPTSPSFPSIVTAADGGYSTTVYEGYYDFNLGGLGFYLTAASNLFIGADTTQDFTLPFTLNVAPIANAGAEQTVRSGSLVTLNGTASYDPDNGPQPLNFNWLQTGGSPVHLSSNNSASPTFIPLEPGFYIFNLTVYDGQDSSPPAQVMINVPALGDIDQDGDIDQSDLNRILAARNTSAAGPNDLRDLNGDGTINALDARKLVTICTRPRCATQ